MRNDKVLVAFLNVTFVRRDCSIGDINVTCTPRVGQFANICSITPPLLQDTETMVTSSIVPS
jgi:hypothetical protein